MNIDLLCGHDTILYCGCMVCAKEDLQLKLREAEAQIERLKDHIRRNDSQSILVEKLQAENKRLALEVERLKEYVRHTNDCILSFFEAGEPTKGGGYRTQYQGVWYQSKPINEEPKCTCGLEEALSPSNDGREA